MFSTWRPRVLGILAWDMVYELCVCVRVCGVCMCARMSTFSLGENPSFHQILKEAVTKHFKEPKHPKSVLEVEEIIKHCSQDSLLEVSMAPPSQHFKSETFCSHFLKNFALIFINSMSIH